MQEVIKCPQCNSEILVVNIPVNGIINDKSISCPQCDSAIYKTTLDHDMIDFMTTGTDPRLAPRSDSG